MDRWSDGSARWALLDFQVSSEQMSGFRLEIDRQRNRALRDQVTTSIAGDEIIIDTGAARFLLRAGQSGWFAGVHVVAARRSMPHAPGSLQSRRREGADSSVIGLRCEEVGRLRTVVLVDGELSAGRQPFSPSAFAFISSQASRPFVMSSRLSTPVARSIEAASGSLAIPARFGCASCRSRVIPGKKASSNQVLAGVGPRSMPIRFSFFKTRVAARTGRAPIM